MSKILILAQSGFGKSTSIGNIPELGIKGLDPTSTYIISATGKPLPFKGSQKMFPLTESNQPPKQGNRYISNNGKTIAKVIEFLGINRPEITNIVLDDLNYVMQDYYMANSLKKGYDTFKNIGDDINAIFVAMENLPNINFYALAHYEEYKDSSADTVGYRFKTVGKMVQDYITPEGKFDIVLFGKQTFNEQEKKAYKEFVTNYDGQFPAKSPVGMFEDIYIPNDLGYISQKIDEYYN